MTENVQIISLDRSDIGRACELMVANEMNRLVLRHACPLRADDNRLLAKLNLGIVDYGLKYGQVLTTPDLQGLAIWFAPGQASFKIHKMIRTKLTLAPFQLGLRAVGRVFGLMEKAGAVHRKTVPGLHWYLYNITVHSDSQGQGIARALMEPILCEADRQKVPVYLESRSEETIGFYEKLGFVKVCKIEMEKGSSVFWPMVRSFR